MKYTHTFTIFTIITIGLLHFSSCSLFRSTPSKAYIEKYMNEQYEEIKEGLPDAVVTKIQDTIKVIFSEGVLFDIGSASLNNERVVKQFDTFASVLNHYRQTRILINGYTDNTGDENYNFKLSLERANNSKKLLVDNQVSELRIFTNGLGSKKPIASNNTKQGRSKNRRIEFVILYDLNKNSKK